MDPDADFSVVPSAKGGQVTFEPLCTFFNVASVTTEITAELAAKHDGGESTTCQQSIRVRLHFCPFTNFELGSRITPTIVKSSRRDLFIETKYA